MLQICECKRKFEPYNNRKNQKFCSLRCRKRVSFRQIRKRNPELDNARVRNYHRQRFLENPDYYRTQDLKKHYNLSIEDYELLLKEQNGKCAICGAVPLRKRLHVDHNHKTKRNRGLLCGNCNTSIGKMKDSPELLMRAISYLEKYNAI